MAAFAAEKFRYPELREEFDRVFVAERRAHLRTLVAAAVERGELPADTDVELLAEAGPALLWHALTVRNDPGDDACRIASSASCCADAHVGGVEHARATTRRGATRVCRAHGLAARSTTCVGVRITDAALYPDAVTLRPGGASRTTYSSTSTATSPGAP